MPNRDAERLKEYLKLITKKIGGIEGQIDRLARGDVPPRMKAATLTEGFESLAQPTEQVRQARDGMETIATGNTPTDVQMMGMEAIIKEDLRPAIDVIDGKFTSTHPLWLKLSNDATLRARIEAAIPSIGRIELPGHPDFPYGGTGFVVGANLIMTNRHVAEIFARGLGVKDLNFVPKRKAGIDFKREQGRPTGPTLSVSRIVMIHPYWDMAILEVNGLPDDHKPLRLSLADARDLTDREIFIVGYPAFDPRNPSDIQQNLFDGRYGVKRLQPGQLQGGMQTASFGKVVPAATHDCSTLGGNSGSAVVDLTNGEVLALHFGGEFHARNYCVPAFALSRDSRVVDAGVVFAGAAPGGQNDWLDWWKRADESTIEAAEEDDAAAAQATASVSSTAARPAASTAGASSVVTARRDGSVSIEVPLYITISLGQAVETKVQAARESVAGMDMTEAMRAPVHDTDYSSRQGYDPLFLNDATERTGGALKAPMPNAADQSVLAKTKRGGHVLHYQNFSIRMHAKRRLALVTASNVTREPKLRKPEAGRDYTRKGLTGLGPNDQELWFLDNRLDESLQIPDVFFTKDRQAFDKGHIVRRDDVAWGETYASLRRANGDSYHVTNCSPQVAEFNRSASGKDNWGDLENHVLSEAANERLCVFAGPVLEASDEVFVGRGDGNTPLRAKIPSRFWKVIVARVNDGLAAYGFVLEQDLSDVQFEFVVPKAFAPAMYSIADIEEMAGVLFAESIRETDQYDTVRGTEVAMRSGSKRKKRSK